jgi:rSAM/selenodomain-associated transferase 2/rSAM/selenodomain-associated transferase 1
MTRIIIFTRFPEIGKCKTRLIPLIGVENATELHRRMTERMISVCNEYARKHKDCQIEIGYSGGTDELMTEIFGNGNYRMQPQGNLGIKMFHFFKHAFDDGFESVIIAGSDCPEISPKILEKAFADLQNHALVLGPAEDGGYYLIGMNRAIGCLFPENMPWGTSSVLKETLEIAEKQKFSVALLPKLADLDRPEDLLRICNHPLLRNLPKPLITIVIPTLNEASLITDTMDNAKGDNIEIIVADGGSSDNTAELAKAGGAIVVQSPKGRGRQLNEGARHANANMIVFLHADTLVPDGFVSEVMTILAKPGISAGAFRLSISGKNRALGLISRFANIRSILFQMPYGDQAVFLKKENFVKAGGFPDIPIMEDYALILRLKKIGCIGISSNAVQTSGRRWDNLGYIRTLIINQLMIIGFHLGIKPDALEKFYRLKT